MSPFRSSIDGPGPPATPCPSTGSDLCVLNRYGIPSIILNPDRVRMTLVNVKARRSPQQHGSGISAVGRPRTVPARREDERRRACLWRLRCFSLARQRWQPHGRGQDPRGCRQYPAIVPGASRQCLPSSISPGSPEGELLLRHDLLDALLSGLKVFPGELDIVDFWAQQPRGGFNVNLLDNGRLAVDD